MPQTRTISAFLAAMPGIDDRILRDVGLSADGNFVDNNDPRIRRLKNRRRVVELLNWLLSMGGYSAASAKLTNFEPGTTWNT